MLGSLGLALATYLNQGAVVGLEPDAYHSAVDRRVGQADYLEAAVKAHAEGIAANRRVLGGATKRFRATLTLLVLGLAASGAGTMTLIGVWLTSVQA